MQLLSRFQTPILSIRSEMIRLELIHLNEVVCSENARTHTHSMRDTIDMLNIVICFHFVTFTWKEQSAIQTQAHQFYRHKKRKRMENMCCVLRKCLIFMQNHHSNLWKDFAFMCFCVYLAQTQRIETVLQRRSQQKKNETRAMEREGDTALAVSI